MGDMEAHERVVVEGKTAKLQNPLVHHNVNSLSRYILKHDEYSNWEAQAWLAGESSYHDLPPSLFASQAQRRRWLKKNCLGAAGLTLSVLSVQIFLAVGISGWCARTNLLRLSRHPVFSHQGQDLRIAHEEDVLSTTPTDLAADAVAYHASLANEWERRYRKPSFQMRQTVLLKSLEGRELADTHWLDAGCGTGTLARWLATRGCSVIGVDAASEMVEAAQSVPNETVLSGSALSEYRRSPVWGSMIARWTAFCARASWSTSLTQDACLAEFARVLRPGGLLLVSVPNRNSVVRRLQLTCHELGGLFGHSWCRFLDYSRHQYSRPEFERLLTQAGFSGEKDRAVRKPATAPGTAKPPLGAFADVRRSEACMKHRTQN